MSYEPVADGELAAVVTYLEMRQPPAEPAPPAPLSLWKVEHPDPDEYRELFRRIGSPWLWFSRLIMSDAQLDGILSNRDVELFKVVHDELGDVGMLELDFRHPGECELAFLGFVPELTGQGYGRWLLTHAAHMSWRDGVSRVHVHTCSLDHPAALPAYRRAGFTPFKRAIERFPDPRLLGILPMDAAPQIPVVGTPTCASPRPAS
jgi:GNAT superfamily N-acetyltransferase